VSLASPPPLLPRRTTSVRPQDADRLVGRMSPEDYAAFDRAALERHEHIDGEVVRMAGGSPEHNLIAANVLRALGNGLEAADCDCDAYGSDQKVYIGDRTSLYPDVQVVCGGAQFDHYDRLLNPAAVVEVLSPSTAAFDRGEKFELYQTLPSLRHYLLIEQHRASVTHFEKLPAGLWAIVANPTSLDKTLSLTFGDASVALPLNAIYRRVEFPAPQAAPNDAPEE
jgi:Uma2 family endonuclease